MNDPHPGIPVPHQNWPHPERQEFSGQFVRLQPLNAREDSAGLFLASHGTPAHQALWQFLFYGPFQGADSMRVWLESIEAVKDPLFLTARQVPSQKRVGMLSIMNIVPEMGRAELGHIWYAPEAQRTKINTEAVFLLLRYLFEDLHYRRIEWKCDARNLPSRNAALRLGFAFEGLFRQHMIVKGLNRDTAWFSLLDHEWPRLKPNFIRWLYEEDGFSLRVLNARVREGGPASLH